MPGVVCVHGAGAAGADAWPRQAGEPGWRFLSRGPGGDDSARDAGRVLDLLRSTGGGHVVAHSYGANAALLAALQDRGLVRSLALLEPACFDLARGMPAVEEHVSAMTPALAAAADPAAALAGLGTVHLTLPGAAHRVQDDPRTTGLLQAFWQG